VVGGSQGTLNNREDSDPIPTSMHRFVYLSYFIIYKRIALFQLSTQILFGNQGLLPCMVMNLETLAPNLPIQSE
jgi:hypothetical protein